MIPDELYGPFALLAGALLTIGVLWRDHTRSDRDDRDERDRWRQVAIDLMAQIPGLTAAVAKQTGAITELEKQQRNVKRLGT